MRHNAGIIGWNNSGILGGVEVISNCRIFLKFWLVLFGDLF